MPGLALVKIGGVEFALHPSAVEEPYLEYPQPQFVGETQEQFWVTWATRSWHGGERMVRILEASSDLPQYRYDDGEGVDVSTWGKLSLQPALTLDLTVESAYMPMTLTTDGTTVVLGLAISPYVKLWTAAGGWTSAASVAGSGAVTDLLTVGTTLYGVRGGAVITSTDAGANWTAVGSYTTATGVAYVSGDLIVGKSDGIYNHTQTEDISTTLSANYITSYREDLYWIKDRRLYRYDGRASWLFDELPVGFNATGLFSYRQLLFVLGYYKVGSGYRSVVHYVAAGTENHLYTLGDYSADHRIYAICGGDDEVFVASPDRGGVDRFDLTGGLSCGPAWTTAGHIPFKSLAYCEGRLFVGRYDANSTIDGVYICRVEDPTSYRASGWITSPEFDFPVRRVSGYFGYDFDFPNQLKIFKEIAVQHSALTAGQSVKVEYSIDSGTTWTLAGISNSSRSTGEVFQLLKVTGPTFKWRLTLTAGTSQLTTPEVHQVYVLAAPISRGWMWDLKLAAYPPYGGAEKIAALRALVDAADTTTFTDLDDTTHQVVLDTMKLSRNPNKEDMAMAIVRLREV